MELRAEGVRGEATGNILARKIVECAETARNSSCRKRRGQQLFQELTP